MIGLPHRVGAAFVVLGQANGTQKRVGHILNSNLYGGGSAAQHHTYFGNYPETTTPDYIITDGYYVAGLEIPSRAMWRGDQVSESVGAASILAKNYRDHIMIEWDDRYPDYGFAQHKGYGTALHQRALEKYGVLPIHRKSFAPIARLLESSDLRH